MAGGDQFSVKGVKYTRRPDIILFVNGLPQVLLELKNPADEKADIWKAYDQIQTYKEQIPDVFLYNELLVISDGTDMWLTGFDAPCVHTMYVDKPMKGHNLMQDIARVNRVFCDKQVDWWWITSALPMT